MAKRNTEWTLGKRDLRLPPMPPDQQGRIGCRLLRTTFDPAVGEEVYVLFMEDPAHVRGYANIEPFKLFAHRGLVRTDYGIVACIVWRIAADSPKQVLMEQFLNPYRQEALQVLSDAANQTHLKLMIVNNQSGEAGAFVDFENVFGLGEFVEAMKRTVEGEAEGDFELVCRYVREKYPVATLLGHTLN